VPVERALVVGGGIAGMSTAIVLRKLGIDVDLIDRDPAWRTYGAGITISSPTLRAFEQLGILEDVLRSGYSGHGIRVCDVDGNALREIADPPSFRGSGGILRPELHRILSGKVVDLGTEVRLGVTCDAIAEREDGTVATFSDGRTGTYDLVVGADGLYSSTRRLVFPDAPVPEYTGQTVWRLIAERPEDVDRRHFFLGGPTKVGLSPVSESLLYVFALETCERGAPISEADAVDRFRALLDGYGGIIGKIRDGITSESSIVVRPLEAFSFSGAWFRGRTVLVGDAAHPTTPQLASGAGMAVEDAIVLGQALSSASTVDDALATFMHRRGLRCRTVVENSLHIGRLEQSGAPSAEQTQLVADSLEILAQPI
jgi:2-polyprenyl-6-methoxyphenol hydroxylase-like FAD-dependent oxidoreductase